MATVAISYVPDKHAAAIWGKDCHSGPGVYGCFWDGELFYIGTYAGKDTDLCIGNVAGERWWKHIEGITFRSRRLGIASSRLRWIEERHCSPLAELLGQGDRAKLTKKHGNGIQVQYNKFLFADRHWKDFSVLSQQMMARFSFIYVRPNLANAFIGMTKEEIDPHLRAVETRAVKLLQPPCNGATKVYGRVSSVQQTTNTIEQFLMEQAEGFVSGGDEYRLMPRKHRQFKKR